jgi:hypothetical protein
MNKLGIAVTSPGRAAIVADSTIKPPCRRLLREGNREDELFMRIATSSSISGVDRILLQSVSQGLAGEDRPASAMTSVAEQSLLAELDA